MGSSLLFRWRRALLAEQQASAAVAPPTFIPLALPPPAPAAADVPAGSGLIEMELAGGHRVRAALFSYIEGFYNPVRRHSALSYRSPLVYEQEHSPKPATEILISQVP